MFNQFNEANKMLAFFLKTLSSLMTLPYFYVFIRNYIIL